jgi:uroporphyrinogen decarboxylase
LDIIERVNAVLDFKPPDMLPQCSFFSDGFIKAQGGLKKNLYVELGYEIVPIFSNIAPRVIPVTRSAELKSGTSDGSETFTDGWGRLCRRTPASGFIEVIKYAGYSIDSLNKFEFDPPALPERFENPLPDNSHHPRPFTEELSELSSKAFLCGNVYDPFETLARTIGLKNALIALKTNPDELKPTLELFGNYMKELGIAQLEHKSGDLSGIWIWGDIAYNRGLMMSPSTYRELILPPLKDMCSAFLEKGVKIIYHTDGNPREVLPDLIQAGVHAVHPTEQVPGMELDVLLDEFRGKLTFIGGISPLHPKQSVFNEELKGRISKMIELGKQGGLIPGFTNFISANFDIATLRQITKFFSENNYKH